MRLFLFGLLAIVSAIGTLSALGYDSEDAQVLKELAFLIQPSKAEQISKYERLEELAPGVIIYDNDGNRIGTIDALATRNGEVVTVWAQQTEIAGPSISFQNGIAIYSKDEPLRQYTHGSVNAAPK